MQNNTVCCHVTSVTLALHVRILDSTLYGKDTLSPSDYVPVMATSQIKTSSYTFVIFTRIFLRNVECFSINSNEF